MRYRGRSGKPYQPFTNSLYGQPWILPATMAITLLYIRSYTSTRSPSAWLDLTYRDTVGFGGCAYTWQDFLLATLHQPRYLISSSTSILDFKKKPRHATSVIKGSGNCENCAGDKKRGKSSVGEPVSMKSWTIWLNDIRHASTIFYRKMLFHDVF